MSLLKNRTGGVAKDKLEVRAEDLITAEAAEVII
jgi:hypothetical protein